MTALGPITIAGCGRMGLPMLEALVAAGLPARGYDIAAADIRSAEPPITDNAGDPPCSVLISVVCDEAQTEDVLFGRGNFANTANGPGWIILSSTLSPRYVIGLRERVAEHIRLVDAPMSGAQIAARERKLSFMLGGEPEDLDHLQPVFDAMGVHFHRMGPYGSGMQSKVLNNLLAASHTAMTRLVLDWADVAGLDERRLLDLIETSSGRNWLASGFDEIEFARDGWAEDNSIGILVKDVGAALDAAPEGADTRLPQTVQAAIRALSLRPRGEDT